MRNKKYLSGREDLRQGSIPMKATMEGNFVIDLSSASNHFYNNDEVAEMMITADDLRVYNPNPFLLNSNKLFPVFDAKNGMSIGKMTARDFLRKML